MSADIILFGAGGHARALADVLSRTGIAVECAVDPAGADLVGVLMLRSDDDAIEYARQRGLVAALGFGGTGGRLRLARRLQAAGVGLATVVAESATVSRDATVSAGAAILEHAHVGPLASIGVAAVVNTHADVEHDCEVGAGAFIAPGARVNGGARVGDDVMVGSNAVLVPGVVIGDGATVGAGAVVLDDVEAGRRVWGVPAVEQVARQRGSGR